MPILTWFKTVISTFNFFESIRTKKRRLTVTIIRGDQDDGPEEKRGRDLIFINVVNPGYVPVTINRPYLEMSDGTPYKPPGLMSDVSFLYDLQAGKPCRAWIKERDVMEFFTKACGLQGEVQFRGVVQDGTGKVWKSKKWRQDKEIAKERKKIAKQYFEKTKDMLQKRVSRKSDRH